MDSADPQQRDPLITPTATAATAATATTATAATDTPPPPATAPSTCSARRFRLLWRVILSAVLVVLVVGTREAVRFPFYRTLVVCPPNRTALPPANSSSPQWSGSPTCGNRPLVANRAQGLDGRVSSMGMVISLVSLPVLGVLGDAVGRKRMIMLGLLGLVIDLALLTLGAGLRVDAWIYAGTAVNHLISAFNSMLQAMVADLSKGGKNSDAERASNYTLLTLAGVISLVVMNVVGNAGIVARNLSDYTTVFVGLLLVALAVSAAIAFFLKETLSRMPSGGGGGGGSRDGGSRDGGSSDGNSSGGPIGGSSDGNSSDSSSGGPIGGSRRRRRSSSSSSSAGACVVLRTAFATLKERSGHLVTQFTENSFLAVVAVVALLVSLSMSASGVAKAFLVKQFELDVASSSYVLLAFGSLGLLR